MGSRIAIEDSQSERLRKIATDKGVMPNVLLEEALESLFQQADWENGVLDERAFLSQLEREDDGSLEIQTKPPFKKDEFTISHSVTSPVSNIIIERMTQLWQSQNLK